MWFNLRPTSRSRARFAIGAALCLTLTGCGQHAPGGSGAADTGGSGETLAVGAIPDQDPQELARRYGTVADYLADRLGVAVRYEPVTTTPPR